MAYDVRVCATLQAAFRLGISWGRAYDYKRMRFPAHVPIRSGQPCLAFASKFRLRVERRSAGRDVVEYAKFQVDKHSLSALRDATRGAPRAPESRSRAATAA